MPCFNSPITVVLQEKVEAQMHGRVFSLMQVLNSCALPLGMMLFGPLADLIMIETLLLYCGFLVLACTLFVYFSKRYTYTFQYGKKSRFYSGPQAVEFISAASIIVSM